MSVSSWDEVARTSTIRAIDGYKRYISPHKGFACPHRLFHGGESCSDYVRSLFLGENFTTAIRLSGQRFQDCAIAGRRLQAQGCIVIPCCIPI